MKTDIRLMLPNTRCSIQALLLAMGLGSFGWIIVAPEAKAGPPAVDHVGGPREGRGQTTSIEVGENTEKSGRADDPGAVGFSISVDGDRLAGDAKPVDVTRKADLALNAVDIQVKFDGLDARPILNVATADLRHSYLANDRVTFNVTTNYPNWIKKAEIRIYDAEHGMSGRPLDLVDVKGIGEDAHWVMPPEGPEKYLYVLRVYDGEGRFDETVPLALRRTARDFATHATAPQMRPVSAGRAEDRTSIRNIPVHGGSVTVFGRDVPAAYKVTALGESVPLDPSGSFVVQRILPPGAHTVDIDVKGAKDGHLNFSRDIEIPENEWFYVGMADLTVGKRFGSKELVPAAPGEYESVYNRGRLAFYLKGKIKGRYLLTASADTGEEKVQNLFKNADGKGPQELIRRIDPDTFYPVYGDDSTAIEDAPTDGKFYVRLERDGSHVLWGRFKTTIRGTEFARNERKLYGGHGRYQSETSTSHGAPRMEAEAYASRPGTLPQRDSLLGTGGSVYFLSRQDINRGSETVTVEVRDIVSDVVLTRRSLRYGEDYDINYVQGVVILKKPLSSSTRAGDIVSDGTLGGNRQFLMVQYEYTPAVEKVKGYSSGGRVQGWVTDNFRAGISGISEQTGAAAQEIISADAHLRLSKNSYIEAETARSEGPGFRSSTSINGGLTITGGGLVGDRNRTAYADRARAHLDLADFGVANKGAVGAFYERRDAGFSSLGYDTRTDQRTYGALADLEIRQGVRLKLKYKDYWNEGGQSEREGAGQIEYDWTPHWIVGVGVKHKDVSLPGLGVPGLLVQDGGRTDAGVKLTHKVNEDRNYYVFGQGTVERSGNISRNDRGGVGTEFRVTEKIGLAGELSYGSLGWGGLAAINYDPTPDDRNYFGYTLDPDRSISLGQPLIGTNRGRFIVGSRHKFSENVSAYAENNYDMFGIRQVLTSTYGVVYTPSALWSIGGGIEYGDIKDSSGTGDIERIAPSISIGFKDPESISWRLKGEARFDDSPDIAKDRTTYLAAAGLSVAMNSDWKFLAGLDAAISDSDQISILDGDYIKGSVGYAFRPVGYDWLNGIFKFIFIYDLPGPDQINAAGNKLGPAQRSYILSADGNYGINRYLTLGAKYGFRIGEVSHTRSSRDFEESSAHLGIIRADLHVVKNWDLMMELRALHTTEIDTTKYGFVSAIYRHVREDMKIGVGYNFGRFSDDVSDLTHDDGGVFVNIVGKF